MFGWFTRAFFGAWLCYYLHNEDRKFYREKKIRRKREDKKVKFISIRYKKLRGEED